MNDEMRYAPAQFVQNLGIVHIDYPYFASFNKV